MCLLKCSKTILDILVGAKDIDLPLSYGLCNLVGGFCAVGDISRRVIVLLWSVRKDAGSVWIFAECFIE